MNNKNKNKETEFVLKSGCRYKCIKPPNGLDSEFKANSIYFCVKNVLGFNCMIGDGGLMFPISNNTLASLWFEPVKETKKEMSRKMSGKMSGNKQDVYGKIKCIKSSEGLIVPIDKIAAIKKTVSGMNRIWIQSCDEETYVTDTVYDIIMECMEIL